MIARLPAGAFYGKTQSRVEAAGFTFVESAYAVGSQLHLPLHRHENAFLCFVIAGVCEESYGSSTRIVSPSSLVVHPAGEPHANRWGDAGGRVFHIDVSRARARALDETTLILSQPAAFQNGVIPWLARRLYTEYLRQDNVTLLAMEGLVLEILAEVCRHPVPSLGHRSPRWLLRVKELLHARFTEPLSLEEIASEVGVHPVHVSRVFRRQFECTLGDYLRKLRVEAACRQLARSDSPLIEVALAAGFSDQSHFTKTFRRIMRMTPGEFRRHSAR
jgi:AraC family transcriptional regulator